MEKVREVKLHVPDFEKGENFGLLAQDLQPYFSELVRYDSLEMTYAVNYTGFVPVLISAINGQQDIIQEQQTEIDALKKRLLEIEKLLNKRAD